MIVNISQLQDAQKLKSCHKYVKPIPKIHVSNKTIDKVPQVSYYYFVNRVSDYRFNRNLFLCLLTLKVVVSKEFSLLADSRDI